MVDKEYLLDSNIVITVWNKYPKLLEDIENTNGIDFKISKEIAGELSRKEYRNLKGVPVLSDRFIKLLGHVIDDLDLSLKKDCVKNSSIKYENNMYFVEGNKISVNDYNLIHICKDNKGYVLVTEDRRMFDSAKLLLGSERVLNFDEFIRELEGANLI